MTRPTRFRGFYIVATVLATLALLQPALGFAAIQNVVGGELIGAFDVEVNGELFDVEFIDGTCISVFEGCDELSDFSFETAEDSLDAAHALLDQVFLDSPLGLFDSDPSLTRGCPVFANCEMLIPHDLFAGMPPSEPVAIVTVSRNGFTANQTYPLGLPVTTDTLNVRLVFATFTPVPEPKSAISVGIAFLFMLQRPAPRKLSS